MQRLCMRLCACRLERKNVALQLRLNSVLGFKLKLNNPGETYEHGKQVKPDIFQIFHNTIIDAIIATLNHFSTCEQMH